MSSRIPSLDGLRAISVLLVILGHAWRNSITELLAGMGVLIFFVISGYLITTLLQNEWNRTGKIDLLAFYRRRSFRIFPAAFAYIAVIALVCPDVRPALPYAVTYTVSYAMHAVPLAFSHLWSLSVEEQFYLLWPFALVVGFRYRQRVALGAMVFAALFRLAIGIIGPAHHFIYLHTYFPGTMDSIAAGCLLAIYGPQLRQRLDFLKDSAAVVIALPVVAWIVQVNCWGIDNNVISRAMPALFGVVPLLIAIWVLLLIERRDVLLNNPIATVIGVGSYSLYLWQQPFTLENGGRVLPAMLALVVCACGSYFLIERPMIQLGRKAPTSASPSPQLLPHVAIRATRTAAAIR